MLGIALVCHHFRVSKNFLLEMALPRFSVETFCLALSKNFVGEPSVFRKHSGIENFMEKSRGGSEGGSIKIFRRIFFVTSVEKLRRGKL